MANLNESNIRDNIFKLVEHAGITDIHFSLLLGISDRQLKRIKTKSSSFTIGNINTACDFFLVSIDKLNKENIVISVDFRRKLRENHKGNLEYEKVLNDRPPIIYAIKFMLFNYQQFLNDGMDVNDIRIYLQHLGYDYSSAYISLGLSRVEQMISKKKHPSRKNAFLYSKK